MQITVLAFGICLDPRNPRKKAPLFSGAAPTAMQRSRGPWLAGP